jgi:hypothetical protein
MCSLFRVWASSGVTCRKEYRHQGKTMQKGA